MTPLAHHPYVRFEVSADGTGALSITCHCRLCADRWQYRCTCPPKAKAWVARYGAQHAHGAPGVRERFAREYHSSLGQLRAEGG